MDGESGDASSRAAAAIAELIDQFANEYGWEKEYTVKNTYFQLRELSRQIADRTFKERKVF